MTVLNCDIYQQRKMILRKDTQTYELVVRLIWKGGGVYCSLLTRSYILSHDSQLVFTIKIMWKLSLFNPYC